MLLALSWFCFALVSKEHSNICFCAGACVDLPVFVS